MRHHTPWILILAAVAWLVPGAFAASIPGTLRVLAPIAPGDTADTYPTHMAAYGKGGLRTVADIAARDAIPAARREEGMLVYTADSGQVYRLAPDLVSWSQAPALRWRPWIPNSVYASGDSITHGASATNPTNRWVDRLASANGWAAYNLAYGSAGMPDFIWQSYPGFAVTNAYDSAVAHSPGAVTTNHQWALLAGYNDMRDFGTSASRVDAFRRGLMAWIGWVGTPTAKVRLAQQAIQSGSWTAMSWFGGNMGVESSTPGAMLTFTNLVGDALYLCYGDGATSTNGATFSVWIDGSLYTTITATNGYGNREWRNGSDPNIPNQSGPYGNGKIDVLPSVLRIPNLGMRPHSLVVSNLSSTTGPLRVFWAVGNAAPQSRSVESGPFVYVGGCLRQAVYTGAGSDEAAAIYTAAIRDVVTTMAGDGWPVRYAPASESWDPTVHLHEDGVHPSDAGMEPIARAFRVVSGHDETPFAHYVSSARGLTLSGGAVGDVAADSIAIGTDPVASGDVRLSPASVVAWKHPSSMGTGASIAQEGTGDGLNVTWSNLGDDADRSVRLLARGSDPLVNASLISFAGTATPAVRFDLTGGSGLTASTNEQVAFQVKTKVSQSGAAGFAALDVLADVVTKGSGSAILLRVADSRGVGLRVHDSGYVDMVSQSGGSTAIFRGMEPTNSQVRLNYGSATDRQLIAGGNTLYSQNSAGAVQNLGIGNGGASSVVISSTAGNGIRLGSSSGPLITFGEGSPEGVVTAPVGSIYLRSDGGAGTSLYIKETGSGNSGWAAK